MARPSIFLRLASLTILLVGWLIPFFLTGSLIQPSINVYSRLTFQYGAAALFTRRVTSWTQIVIQVRTSDAREWKSVDASELSPMGAFGYRQRLDRILQETRSNEMAQKQSWPRLAAWVAEQHQKLRPEMGKVDAVRFMQLVWQSNSPELTKALGHWEPLSNANLASEAGRHLATYEIRSGTARLTSDERRNQRKLNLALPPAAKVHSRPPDTHK